MLFEYTEFGFHLGFNETHDYAQKHRVNIPLELLISEEITIELEHDELFGCTRLSLSNLFMGSRRLV